MNQPNVTNAILAKIGEEISVLAEQGRISDWRYTVLEARLVELSGVQAGCERIKTTPLPYAYTLLIHRTNYLFCFLLPFGLSATARLGNSLAGRGRELRFLRPRCAWRRAGGPVRP